MKYRGSIAFLGGIAAALCAGWIAFPRVLYKTESQPIQFSHRVHTGDKVMAKCEDCHTIAADGHFSGIPRLEKCSACHQAPLTDKADEKALIDKYVTPNREIPWLSYSRQPENVWFSHATHTKKAELACERCHGDHGKTDKLRPYQENRISGYSRDIWGESISRISFRPLAHPGMKMDDCVRCHEERGVSTSCMGCHK